MTTATIPAPVQPDTPGAQRYWNPYIGGAGLGLTLLASYMMLGTGRGAAATPARLSVVAAHVVAPAAMEANAYAGGWFDGGSPLANYLVFMSLGVILGGFLSAFAARRTKLVIERGPSASVALRLTLAAVGGGLVGFASRLAAGCTSGQALSGGAMMFTGSWAFMIAIFAGAFGAAHFVRKEWT
ncbi:MAG: YeeE/YedE thiosulfate transporter family protein [Myxococcota bacterium]